MTEKERTIQLEKACIAYRRELANFTRRMRKMCKKKGVSLQGVEKIINSK